MTRVWLRRCGPWLPLLLALSFFALFNRGAPWRGEWAWSLDAVTGTTVLAGPGTSALAAWLAAADRARRPVTDPLRRQWAVVPLDAVLAWGTGVLALAVTLATVAALDLTTTHGGPAWVPVLVLEFVVLGFYSALGAAIGWRCPPLIAVVSAPILAFGLGPLGATGTIPNLLRLGPSTASLAGLTWDHTVAVGQGLTAAGLAAALLVTCARAIRTRSMAAWAAMVVSLAVFATGFGVLLGHGDGRFVISSEQTSSCMGTSPQVCAAPSNERSLRSLSDRMSLLAGALGRAEVAVPARFSELLPDRPPGPGTGFFALPSANAASVSEVTAAEALARPAACPQWFGLVPPPMRVFEARELVAQWIVVASGGQASPYGASERRWLARPFAAQAPWVRSTYGHLRSCRLDEIVLPWGNGR